LETAPHMADQGNGMHNPNFTITQADRGRSIVRREKLHD
jgi:hypothetical protein